MSFFSAGALLRYYVACQWALSVADFSSFWAYTLAIDHTELFNYTSFRAINYANRLEAGSSKRRVGGGSWTDEEKCFPALNFVPYFAFVNEEDSHRKN